MATIFPDIETIVVGYLNTELDSAVWVATKKPAPDVTPYPSKIVTVRGDGGSEIEPNLTRTETVGINVFASTYADASDLARQVESLMRTATVSGIKHVSTTRSPIRIDTESSQEQRYAVFACVVKATDN